MIHLALSHVRSARDVTLVHTRHEASGCHRSLSAHAKWPTTHICCSRLRREQVFVLNLLGTFHATARSTLEPLFSLLTEQAHDVIMEALLMATSGSVTFVSEDEARTTVSTRPLTDSARRLSPPRAVDLSAFPIFWLCLRFAHPSPGALSAS